MRQSVDIRVRQGAATYARTQTDQATTPFIAQIISTYPERMTCDIETVDGELISNVPVLTRGGLVDGKPYGEISLPVIGDYVIVIYGSYGTRHKIIIGTFFPYLANELSKEVVNSDSKQFTKKLFEGTPLSYRRIFPSGTTVEIAENGDVTIEHPNGTFVTIDESVTVTDHNANSIVMESSGVTVSDSNGNTIDMGSSSVTINGNLEVLQ